MLRRAVIPNKYSLSAILWLLAILLGVFQGWVNRYNLSTDDAISYLDIGDAYLRGEWNSIFSGRLLRV